MTGVATNTFCNEIILSDLASTRDNDYTEEQTLV